MIRRSIRRKVISRHVFHVVVSHTVGSKACWEGSSKYVFWVSPVRGEGSVRDSDRVRGRTCDRVAAVCDLLNFVDSSDLKGSDDEQDLSSSPRLGTPSSAQQPKEFSPASPTGPPLPRD